MEFGIELKDVSFTFLTHIQVLQNVNVSFKAGEFVGIVGPNASGKTTLARLLNGCLLPTAGSVSVDGLSSGLAENQLLLKRMVTVIHSDAENQLITPTVWDELTFALQALGTDEPKINRLCEGVLDTFDLRRYRDVHPFYLSVGEQFRLLLAAGFVRNPRYFVLDEVLSMLDVHMRESVLQMLLSLRSQSGVGIILLTHRLDDLVNADRIVVLHNGQVKMEGPVSSIFRDALERSEWNIEVPLTYRIYNSLNPIRQKRFAELSCRMPIPL